LSSIRDKESRLDCWPSNNTVSSQHKLDALTCENLCKNESADGTGELENDLKCMSVCPDEKISRTDRRQRREKRPDVQRYVPKPRQQPLHDLDEDSATTAVKLKSADHKSECASDQKRDNTESCKSDAVSLPQSSAKSAPNANRTFENSHNLELVPQSHQLESQPTAKHCSSEYLKSSVASVPHSVGDLPLAGSKTAEPDESSDPAHGRTKQRVPKPVKSRNNEPKQDVSEHFDSPLALRNAVSDKRGKPDEHIRSEELDWDFDGEFEYNHDGVSWGDLPSPSDHEWSDEDGHDDATAPTQSAANTRKQKPQKQRVNRRKRRQKTEMSECAGGSSVKSNTVATAGGSRSTKLERMVVTNRQFTDNRESPVRSDERPSKNHDVAVDGHCSEKVSMESYSHSRHQRKDTAERPHSAVKTERRAESKEQRQIDRNSVQSGGKLQSVANVVENRREENAQRPGSGRVGGIIRLPIGTVTTASHDAAPSHQSQASTATRGRNRRSAHSTSGRRAVWSADALEPSAQKSRGLPGYDPAQLHPAYRADYAPYYQRQSASPSSQLYYAEYPPASGTSQMPAVDGYMYGYSQATYDGLGYIDESYYH